MTGTVPRAQFYLSQYRFAARALGMPESDADGFAAYAAGRDACSQGYSVDDCPFPAGQRRTDWLSGYRREEYRYDSDALAEAEAPHYETENIGA